MDKGTKRRKKHAKAEDTKAIKKRKLAVAEETKDRLVPSEPTLAEPAVTPKNDPSIASLRKDIYDWMEEQSEYEKADLDTLLEESNHSSEHEEVVDIERLQSKLGTLLLGYTPTQIRKSFKMECEWRKCKFMTGKDRKYFLHVESHAEQAMDSQNGSYTCDWDLCDFITEDSGEYMGHVHYHAYHTKLKVYGASVHALAKLPSCNIDSRARNNITNKQVTFRCEWANCNEHFDKAMHFFHHVRNHFCDQFPPDRKSSADGVDCLWSLCKERFKIRFKALMHIRRHTTEREIACFNCGMCFWDRLKIANHLIRQIEMSQRKFECELCGRCYATKVLLHAHVEAHDKPHECTLCPMKFPSQGNLTIHMLHRHLKQRNFHCNQCEFAAFSKSQLVSHMRTHDSTKIFRCEEFGCNVAYRSELAMKKHFAWHYNIPPTLYGCHICSDKTYKNSYHLSKHLRFVHQVERAPGYMKFHYKADSDGVYRLATYVDQKFRQSKAPILSADTVSDSRKNKSNDSVNHKKKKTNEKAEETACEENQEKISHNAIVCAPIEGKPKISSIKSIGVHEFLFELGMEPEPAETEQQQSQAVELKHVSKANGNDTKKVPKRNSEVVHAKREREQVVRFNIPHDESSIENVETSPQAAQQPKDVKDFTVMKRYLKPSKKSG